MQIIPMNQGKSRPAGYGDNLSASGMFVATANPRKPGDRITVRFALPDGGGELSVMAEVVWARKESGPAGEEPGMGIRFLDPSPDFVARLREFVTSDRK
jgi:uncharacterized protein (TIGR02266 family)